MVMVEATTFQKTQTNTKPTPKISWEAFQREFLTREDNYKYEWVNGRVERTLRFAPITSSSNTVSSEKSNYMHQSQFFILDNLLELFSELKIKHNIKGQLISEGDTFFAKQHRRPDIAFYTKKQIRAAKDNKLKIPPQFVIEIISTNDQANAIQQKLINYRAAKVPIVWLIFPQFKEVQIYRGKKSEIFEGDDLCSAEPVIKDFVISVKDVFK